LVSSPGIGAAKEAPLTLGATLALSFSKAVPKSQGAGCLA